MKAKYLPSPNRYSNCTHTFWILLIFFTVAPSAHLWGSQLNLDARFDYIDANMDFDNSSIPNYKGFEVTDLRLDYKGSYNNKHKYRFRYNYRKSSNNNDFDKVAPGIEYAYIQSNFSKRLSLQIGKVAVLIGGIEYDYLSADIYRYSLVGDGFPVFEVGSTLTYSLNQQIFKLQFVNSDKSTSATNKRDQDNLAYATAWYGSFFEGMLKPIFGIAIFPQSQGKLQTDHIALGAKLKIGPSDFDLDYLTSDIQSTNTKNTSIVAKISYALGQYKPSLKIMKDNSRVSNILNNTQDFSAVGLDIGLAYFPDANENIRYHLVYSGYAKTFDSANIKSTNEYKVFLGTKFNIALIE